MRIGVIQFESKSSDSLHAKIGLLWKLLPLKNQCDLLILPELWLEGAFEFSNFNTREELLAGKSSVINSVIERFKQEAKLRNYWILIGSFLIEENKTVVNRAFLISSSGDIVDCYDKNHIFGFTEGEAKFVSARNSFSLVKTPWGTMSISICYDLRFPELYRKMVIGGAEIFVVIAAWPIERIQQWKILLLARAVENQAIVIGCNGVGLQTDAELGGHSLVVNPDGSIASEAGEGKEVLLVDVDTSRVGEIRNSFPVLKNIRMISG